MAVKKISYSFMKGTKKVAYEYHKSLQLELMSALGCKTKQHYYRKRKSIINISVFEKELIERIFNQYGINASDIWDIIDLK